MGRSLFSQTRKAKQIWQQSGLINLGSAGPWSGIHSRLTVQGLESPGAHQLGLQLSEGLWDWVTSGAVRTAGRLGEGEVIR